MLADHSLAQDFRSPIWSPIKEMFLLKILPFLVSPQYRSCPSRFPSQRSHRDRRSVYRALFYCLSKSPVNEPPSRFPNGAPVQREMPVYIAFLYISFKVPNKGALPPGSPRSHRETFRFQSPP
jgi:hypothetical protein